MIITGFPIFTYVFLRKYKEKLMDEEFKGRFESLYLNVDIDIDKSILLMSLFVLRRLIYAANIVFLTGNTFWQLTCQIVCSILMLLFLIKVKPLNEPLLNRIEIFNEVTLLTCSYFLYNFTDYVPDVNDRY